MSQAEEISEVKIFAANPQKKTVFLFNIMDSMLGDMTICQRRFIIDIRSIDRRINEQALHQLSSTNYHLESFS